MAIRLSVARHLRSGSGSSPRLISSSSFQATGAPSPPQVSARPAEECVTDVTNSRGRCAMNRSVWKSRGGTHERAAETAARPGPVIDSRRCPIVPVGWQWAPPLRSRWPWWRRRSPRRQSKPRSATDSPSPPATWLHPQADQDRRAPLGDATAPVPAARWSAPGRTRSRTG